MFAPCHRNRNAKTGRNLNRDHPLRTSPRPVSRRGGDAGMPEQRLNRTQVPGSPVGPGGAGCARSNAEAARRQSACRPNAVTGARPRIRGTGNHRRRRSPQPDRRRTLRRAVFRPCRGSGARRRTARGIRSRRCTRAISARRRPASASSLSISCTRGSAPAMAAVHATSGAGRGAGAAARITGSSAAGFVGRWLAW